VAPVVTAGFVLSLYSSAGCRFIDLDVGFVPDNVAWMNQSQAELGLFYYHRDHSNMTAVESMAASEQEMISTNKYRQTFHEGCVWYSDDFDEAIVDKDRTWKVARVMAGIAVCGSLLATLTLWMIVLLPLPVHCVWPGILLPSCMLAFIAEGSKFLFFDIALCRNAVWFPTGKDSLPEEAASCELGTSAIVGIAAAALHLVALLAVCMRSPEKRELDPNFGLPYVLPVTGDDEEERMEAPVATNATERDYTYREDENEDLFLEEDPSMLDEEVYTAGPMNASMGSMGRTASEGDASTVATEHSNGDFQKASTAAGQLPLKETPYSSSVAGGDAASPPPPKVSESRIAAMSKLQLQSQNSSGGSQDLLANLVHDLDSSLMHG